MFVPKEVLKNSMCLYLCWATAVPKCPNNFLSMMIQKVTVKILSTSTKTFCISSPFFPSSTKQRDVGVENSVVCGVYKPELVDRSWKCEKGSMSLIWIPAFPSLHHLPKCKPYWSPWIMMSILQMLLSLSHHQGSSCLSVILWNNDLPAFNIPFFFSF